MYYIYIHMYKNMYVIACNRIQKTFDTYTPVLVQANVLKLNGGLRCVLCIYLKRD